MNIGGEIVMVKVLFYSVKKKTKINSSISLDADLRIEVFFPSLIKLKKHNGGFFSQFVWYIITKSKNILFYVRDRNNDIVHISQLIPKIFKYPFMNSNDFQIGTCWTKEEFRGCGIYPYVINYIVDNYVNSNSCVYMITTEDNILSQSGITKAGFQLVGRGYKKGLLGIYQIEKIVETMV